VAVDRQRTGGGSGGGSAADRGGSGSLLTLPVSLCMLARVQNFTHRNRTNGGVIRRVIAPLSGAVTAAALVAAGVLIATSSAEPAKPAPDEYVIGQFNMAGGTTEYGTKGNAAPDALAAVVKDRKPALITMQETCRDWNRRLRKQLPDYTVVFGPVDNLARDRGSPAQCHHPTDFGNTVVLRKDLGFDKDTAAAHLLGSTSGDEYRQMLCVRSKSRKIVGCTAHLTPGGGRYLESRRREAAEAERILASRYADYTVIVGGDINDRPSSGVLDGFYHRDYKRGAHGALKEAGSPCGDSMKFKHRTADLPRNRYAQCRSGEPTHSRGKIDYLFVSPSVEVKGSSVNHSEQSDHRQLWARVVI